VLRRSVLLLILSLASLYSVGAAQDYGYYVGLTRQPTPVFKSADTTKPAGYLAAGSIVGFMSGITWGMPVDNLGFIKVYLFNNNKTTEGGYSNLWVPDGALDLFAYACDEKPAYGATACPPVDLKGMFHQKWAPAIRSELADQAARLGISLAPQAVIKKAAYDSAVIAAANVKLPDYNPAPWLEYGEPVSVMDQALGIGTRMATREANRQIDRADRKLAAEIDAAAGTAAEAEEEEEALTNASVLDMLASGLSTEIVILKIRASAGSYDLSNKGLKQLQDKKVPMEVISAMMAKK
jgi:hypothetical protein